MRVIEVKVKGLQHLNRFKKIPISVKNGTIEGLHNSLRIKEAT